VAKELEIEQKLTQLNCAIRSLSVISRTGRTKLTDSLTHKTLPEAEANRLLAVLAEMEELVRVSPIPVDWSRPEEVRTILDRRRDAIRILQNEGLEEVTQWS